MERSSVSGSFITSGCALVINLFLTFEDKTCFWIFLYHYSCCPGITRKGILPNAVIRKKGKKFQFPFFFFYVVDIGRAVLDLLK